VPALERQHMDRQIAVVVPNLVERWECQRFLHHQHGEVLTALRLVKGDQRIVAISHTGHIVEYTDAEERGVVPCYESRFADAQ
jgi:hypothetical protein